jgi:DNA segregation ATPase FtsK/SpoIIIE-like protein
MRQAKVKVDSLQESDRDEEEEEEEEGSQHDEEEAEEVDELVSSSSLSPPPESYGRRIPTRRRVLRSRTKRAKVVPTGDEENEGDDEEEAAEDNEQEEDGEGGDDEGIVVLEPRKLRSGRIVGEDHDEQEDEEEGQEQDEEGQEEEEEEGGPEEEGQEEEEEEGQEEGMDVDQESVAIEDEADDDSAECSDSVDQEGQEVIEEDGKQIPKIPSIFCSSGNEVDLTIATAKMLVRLRRDDLIRLCETREIEPSGTKPQLAEALLQWRDRQANEFSSPSSNGTVRPPSARRNRRTRKDSNMTTTTNNVPVLLRSHRVHLDEPRTPVPEKENEDLELDLESLGLEDREIPPEKLTKLEKIGSGGFKDVFIGKFKGRKVAIAEFRGQLNASKLHVFVYNEVMQISFQWISRN